MRTAIRLISLCASALLVALAVPVAAGQKNASPRPEDYYRDSDRGGIPRPLNELPLHEDDGPVFSEPLDSYVPETAETPFGLPLPPADVSAPDAMDPPGHSRVEYPSPEGVENYRLRLEERLLERYDNLPESAGKVGLVQVILSRPLETSIDGKFLRAEFDQLVYDIWGKRMPALEEEYFVVTFGGPGAESVRSEPSLRVGLDLEGSYSEKAPPVARTLDKVDPDEAFDGPPKAEMPSWWRPEFPELD